MPATAQAARRHNRQALERRQDRAIQRRSDANPLATTGEHSSQRALRVSGAKGARENRHYFNPLYTGKRGSVDQGAGDVYGPTPASGRRGSRSRRSSYGSSYRRTRSALRSVSPVTPQLAAEYLLCCLLIFMVTITKKGDYAEKMTTALWRLSAVTFVFFTLALLSMKQSAAKLAVTFGAIVVLGTLYTAGKDLGPLLKILGGQGSPDLASSMNATAQPKAKTGTATATTTASVSHGTAVKGKSKGSGSAVQGKATPSSAATAANSSTGAADSGTPHNILQ